jgi:glyoxylase I family protein
MMKVNHCLHTALLVTNLERSERFYGEILGLSKVDRVLNYPGAWYQLGNFQLHLMVDLQFVPVQTNVQKWGRNPHIALAVDHLGNAIATLQSHGCPIQMSASGRPACFTQDPDGNITSSTPVCV